VAWVSVYVSIGCMIALISLICTEPKKLSPLGFVLAHAFWPVSLVIVALTAMLSSHRDQRSDQ
jgi:hypothetical protein